MKFVALFIAIINISIVNTCLAEDNSTPASNIPYDINGTYWVPKGSFPVNYNRLGKGVAGCVLLKFIINESGSVVEPKIVKSFPSDELDNVALDAVVKYKFKPTKNNSERKPKRSIFLFSYEGYQSRETAEISKKCIEQIN